LHDDDLLITADTIVWLNGKMLGKPHDESEAPEMIRQLSGKVHQVYTGVTFTHMIDGAAVMESLVDKTDVTFRSLSEEEIAYYVENYKPLDKAGAYGVQEYIGYIGVSGMNGSYFNVMGFPIARVYEVLKRLAC
jgi:septum formation protein